MKSFNSVWDRSESTRSLSPAFSLKPARVVFEFANRGRTRSQNFKVGKITFLSGSSLNESRDSVISSEYDKNVFSSVSNVYIPSTLLPDDNSVYCHGTKTSSGSENCSVIGAVCIGMGNDSQCERGKCKIGTLSPTTKPNKWRFDSATVPGLYYYVFGETFVTLKSITRGKFTLPAGQSTVQVDKVASIPTTVYLPPKTYSSETFTRRVIKYYSGDKIISLQDSANNFVRTFLGQNLANSGVEQEVRDRVQDSILSSLDTAWSDYVLNEIDLIWQETGLTNKDFLLRVYEEMSVLYTRCLQLTFSSIKQSRFNVDGSISRPVYNRLPGISGSYNSEDNPNNPSKWLVSGVDSYLAFYKNQILDNFYDLYLNPETCYPACLDWIGQHIGYSSEFWRLNWDNSIKRKLIANAHVNRIEGDLWQTTGTIKNIDLSIIETVNVNPMAGTVTTQNRFFKRSFNTTTKLTSIVPELSLTVDLSLWQGILPSKGSLNTLMVMFYIFGVKAPSAEELKYNSSDNTYSVKSGLRQFESSSPVMTPYMTDAIHVGSDTDSEVRSYPNQLIADVSKFYDDTTANTVVIRMPFYYNRNGRTWDSVVSIVDNFVPTTSRSRVQYAYSAADLMVADDFFFEPVID